MIKKLFGWIITTIIIVTAIYLLTGRDVNKTADIVNSGANMVGKAAQGAGDYIAVHKEDIGGFVNDNVIAPVKQGIEDGTIKQKTQDYINKSEDYAKENDLSGKAKNWFQGVADWFKNGINWAAQNGSVIK